MGRQDRCLLDNDAMMYLDIPPATKCQKLDVKDLTSHVSRTHPTRPTNHINRASIARDTKLTNGTYDCLNFLAVRVATGRVQCVELNEANYASSSATLPDGDDAAARSLSPMSISSGLNASVSSISSVLTAFAETAARSFGSTAYSPCDANGSKMKDRQKAKQKLKQKTNYPNIKPCSECIKEGVYDKVNNPRGKTTSKSCPFHKEPYKEILEGKLSDISAKFVRKTSLEPVVRSGRGASEAGIINEVRKMVDYITELSINAQASTVSTC